jgi:hypothetical protein
MKARSVLIPSVCSALILFLTPFAFGQAVVNLSPTSINFGPVQAGHSSSPQNVTLSNTGNATLTITSVGFTGTNPTDFLINSNTCGSQVLAGGQCTIAVVFKPTRTGVRKANLAVTDNAAGSPQTVSLSGIAQTSPLSFTPESLSFADQAIGTTSVSQNVTVAYIGTAPLTITSLALAETNAGDFSQTNNCGTGLAPNTTCTVTVTFTPTAAWSRSAAIIMVDNSQGSPHLIGVAGAGVNGGVASFSPTNLSFASQLAYTSSASKPVKLTNTGTAPLQLVNITAAGDFSQSNNCPASITVGGFCTINVTFTPTYSSTRQGWLTANFADPAGLQTVLLKGTGTLPTPVAVMPKSASITPNQTVAYVATIGGVQSSNVTWAVDGVNGGNATVGTISGSGLYTPPSTAGRHMVTATNNANTTESASAPVVVSTYAGTLTHHNDTYRTGQNNTEAALTTGNVNKNQFGKLFSQLVDGQVYAEPLWLPNVNLPGKGVHNVVFVATEHDSVYAFDADSKTLNPNPLWHTSFTNPPNVTSIPKGDIEVGLDLSPEVGITSTPVIDTANGTIYLEARTKDTRGTPNCPGPNNVGSPYFHFLHALDLTTGSEKAGSPVMICAQVAGSGYDNSGGVVYFDSMRTHQRPALLLLNGVVYLGFGALEDIDHYHGWVLGYNANTLAQVAVFNDTPNGAKGGIWQSGGGLLADSAGNIYFSTGNGTFDANTGGADYGSAFMRVAPNGSALKVLDYFTPFNQSGLNLEIINADLASAGPMLLPDQTGSIPHLAVACGKTGTIYLMNRDNLGQYNTTGDNIVQALNTTIGVGSVPTGNWGTPAYFNGQIYLQGIDDPLKQYTLWHAPSANPLLSASPMAVSPELVGYPSPVAVVSSNGVTNGIVWEIQSDGNAGGKSATLRAFDAANIGHEIYNSGQSGKRDVAGAAVKFATPTVANGKVYVPSAVELDVYGLLP